MTAGQRLELLVRSGVGLQEAVLEVARTGRNELAERIHVDPKVLSRTLAGEVPGLHVRRGVEQELGLAPYELDKYLEGG